MPNETLIAEIENVLSEIIRLGGENERTQIVPNLTVQDANPSGLDGFVIVSDDRDGDNILAKKVGSIIYNDNDLVNVLFPLGGEAIAFQQGSQSSNSGIWEIVSGTSTDIYYNKGNVGISTPSPDYTLQIGDGAASVTLAAGENIQFIGPNTASGRLILEGTSQADIILIDGGGGANDKAMQLYTDGGLTKFRSFTDAGGIQFDNIIVMDHSNGGVSLRTTTNQYQFQGSTTDVKLWIEDVDEGGERTIVLSRSSNTAARGGQSAYLRSRAGGTAVQNGDVVGYFNFEAHDGTDYNLGCIFQAEIDGAVSANTVPMAFIIKTSETASGGTIDRFHITSDGDIGIGNVTSPEAQVHIDQFQTAEAQPVLLLDQADVDEPFTKYRGTAAAANLTRSIVDEGDVSTATRIGWIKIEIDDVGNQVSDGDYFVPFYSLA